MSTSSTHKHTCPECLKKFSFPESMSGKAVQCPACKKPITLPVLAKPIRPMAESTVSAKTKLPLPRQSTTDLSGSGTSPTSIEKPAQVKQASTLQKGQQPIEKTAQVEQSMRQCPFCAESILPNAIKCKHCGEFLNDNFDGNQLPPSAGKFELGVVLAIIGGGLVGFAFFYDTSVATGNGRVHNMGLQQNQLMMTLLGIALLAVGIILWAFSRKPRQPAPVAEPQKSKKEIYEIARCQKNLIWPILSQVILVVLFVLIPQSAFLLVLLAATILQGIVGSNLANSLGVKQGILEGCLILIPFVGLLILLSLNGKATSVLEEAGHEVGFSGVSTEDLERLRIQSLEQAS